MDDEFDAGRVADLVLPLGSPYNPEAVVRAATTMNELVRRLNHATFHSTTLHYPSQLYRTVGGLRDGLNGLNQTLRQLANRLDGWAADQPRPRRRPVRDLSRRRRPPSPRGGRVGGGDPGTGPDPRTHQPPRARRTRRRTHRASNISAHRGGQPVHTLDVHATTPTGAGPKPHPMTAFRPDYDTARLP